MIWLGLQGERSHSPVTSVCFNQQGGLLLAGYGDGHVTVWDVQRASAAKVITEHTAPVVYAFFLGRDSQGSRIFKIITSDTKGVVFKHTFSWTLLLNMYTVKTQVNLVFFVKLCLLVILCLFSTGVLFSLTNFDEWVCTPSFGCISVFSMDKKMEWSYRHHLCLMKFLEAPWPLLRRVTLQRHPAV